MQSTTADGKKIQMVITFPVVDVPLKLILPKHHYRNHSLHKTWLL